MIILVTASQRASECSAQLKLATGEPVVVLQTFAEATMQLRSASATAVIFDHHLIESEPHEADTARAQLGDAISLDVNFALTGVERFVREVQWALKCRERNLAAERTAAAHALQGELNATLTALLLECEVAASIPDLPAAAVEKLRGVRQCANTLCQQLETAATAHA